MASNSAKFIQLSNGTNLEEVIKELQSDKNPNKTDADLTGYVKEEMLKNYAKTEDIDKVLTTLNQLIKDLKAGKYVINDTTTNK